MKKILISLSLAAAVVLGLVPATAGAAVSFTLSQGSTCGGAASASFTTGGTVQVSVCANTTAEAMCGVSFRLQSGVAGQNEFEITARSVSGTAFPDITTDDATLINAGTPLLNDISNPSTNPDLGQTVSGPTATGNSGAFLVATYTLTARATATASSYTISTVNQGVSVPTTSCSAPDDGPAATAGTFTLNRSLPATSVTFGRTPTTLTFVEDGAAQTVAVNCTGAIGTPSPVTLSVASSNPSAFTVSPTTLSFTSCGTPQDVTVTPRSADASFNPTQTGNVTFTNTTSGGAVVAPSSVGVTVTDNQTAATYTVTKSTATVTENNVATDTLTVTCTGAFAVGVSSGSVAYSIATLTNPGDIATPALSGTLNFASCGGATQSITVTPRANDTTVQGTRTGTVTFSGAVGGTLSGSTTGTITVNDDDADPVFTLAQTGACAEPATNCAFGIVRQSGVVAPRTVSFTVGGTAIRGTDYDLKVGTDCTTGTLVPVGTNSINHTIAGGQTLNVCVIDDSLVEGNETVILTLTTTGSTANSAYTLGSPATGTFTIADDDVAVNAVAGNTGSATLIGIIEGGVARFSVSCPTLAAPLTVNYAITPATPATGDSFVGGGATGSVVCPAAAASLVAVPTTVQTADDAVIGNARSYTMTISVPPVMQPTATVIGNATAVVAVADNDQPLSVPTLGAAGLGLMSLMLAGLAAFQRRRRG